MLAIQPVQAQTNPAVTACGLPAGGYIVQTVTYTLNADCEISEPLQVEQSAALTIQGGGWTIRPAADYAAAANGIDGFFNIAISGPSASLYRVTLDANGKNFASAINAISFTATQTTFQGIASGTWAFIASGQTWNLTNVLFRSNSGKVSANDPSALYVRDGGSLTMNNAAFERNILGSATIRIESAAATVNASGCLSDVANSPRFIQGDFSHSLQPCTGTVGNGHKLRAKTAKAQSCGFPAEGEIRADRTYTLRASCKISGYLYIREGVTVTVNGMAHSIRGNLNGILILVGTNSRLNLINLALDGVRFINHGHIEAETLAFYGLRRRPLYNIGTANFNKLLMDDLDLSTRSVWESAVFSYDIGGEVPGDVTIQDGIFRNISNGSSIATLYAWGSTATITLTGCASFINNSPALIYAGSGSAITDPNTLQACSEDLLAEFPGRYAPPPDEETDENGSGGGALCPSLPAAGHGRFGLIGSEAWRGHFARLGIQAQNAAQQAQWSNGDASVAGINICFWDYECSTDAHWAYGSYQATHGHVTLAPGSRPPLATDRSANGKFNLCYSVWNNGCNSTEAWEFGWESGKQIYDRYFRHAIERSDCLPKS